MLNTFERGAHKTGGGEGWADVWMKGKFAWEYKRKRRSLQEAYQQLLLYREDLENPPLLVVCDLDRFEIHTNFTAKPTVVFAFDLDHLAEPANLDTLRKLFTDPKALEPGETVEAITQDVAERFSALAEVAGGGSRVPCPVVGPSRLVVIMVGLLTVEWMWMRWSGLG